MLYDSISLPTKASSQSLDQRCLAQRWSKVTFRLDQIVKPRKDKQKAQVMKKGSIAKNTFFESTKKMGSFETKGISDLCITISFVHAPNTVKRYSELRKTMPMSHRAPWLRLSFAVHFVFLSKFIHFSSRFQH